MNFIRSFFAFLLAPSVFFSGCTTLVGNIRPAVTKNSHYQVMRLHEKDPTWVLLPPVNNRESADTSDWAWQSKQTKAVISVNSACRKSNPYDFSLISASDQLLLGVRLEKDLKRWEAPLDGQSALVTEASGELDQEKVKILSYVTRKDECIFDLIYLSQPHLFSKHEADFQNFVRSFHVK